MLSKRIIACLDVRDGKVVKGVNFEGLREAGDPATLARRYNTDGIDEAPDAKGLCTFKGTCFPFTQPVTERLKVPHVGWNSLVMPRPSRLMAGVKDGTQVYFTHSYAAPVVDDSVAICEYGVPFSAAVERANVSAVQFHPEKSGDAGLRILSNWLKQTESLSHRSSPESQQA